MSLVYVVVPPADSDGELYVFETEEQAQRFASWRGADHHVSEEPILDDDFVVEALKEIVASDL